MIHSKTQGSGLPHQLLISAQSADYGPQATVFTAADRNREGIRLLIITGGSLLLLFLPEAKNFLSPCLSASSPLR